MPEHQAPQMELSKDAEAVLLQYPWPGNIRELRNAMDRATILWPAQVLAPAALPDRIIAHVESGPVLGGNCSLEEVEREHIVRVLGRTQTQEEAAAILGIDASHCGASVADMSHRRCLIVGA